MRSRFRPPACIEAAALLLVAGATGAAGAVHADATAPAQVAGREKYVQCASCHGSDGRQGAMPQYPKIGGQNAEYVVIALRAYRDGRRQGTYAAIMTEVAKPLTDADIANLAAYVESL